MAAFRCQLKFICLQTNTHADHEDSDIVNYSQAILQNDSPWMSGVDAGGVDVAVLQSRYLILTTSSAKNDITSTTSSSGSVPDDCSAAEPVSLIYNSASHK